MTGNFVPVAPEEKGSTSARLHRSQCDLKERDQLIKQLQAENLLLKGTLREALQLMRGLIGRLQMAKEDIPQEAADFLGMSPAPQRGSNSLAPREMEQAYRGRGK